MKKHLLTKLFVLLGVLLAGTSAWGQTSVTLWEEDWSGTSANQTPATCTMNGYSDITYTYTNGGTTTRTQAKSSFTDPELLISKGSGKFSATIPASKLSGVETTLSLTFSCNRNLTVNVTNGTLGSNTGSGNTYTYAVTVTSTSSDLVLEFVNGTSSNARFSNISLTGTSTGGGTLTPVISASDPATLAYDATGGTINYTITNGTGNVSAVSSESWLTIGTITSSTVPFTVSTNNTGADRTATVTLSFSGAADKVVTVTQGHLFTPTDGVFDFTSGEAYGSGLTTYNTQVTDGPYTFTAGNITLTTGGNFAYYNSSTPPQLRVYKNSSFTISAPAGYTITAIDFVGSQNFDHVTASAGTYTAASATAASWSGSEQSVTFTQDGTSSANPWYNTITVTYSAAAAGKTLYIKSDYAPYVWAWYGNDNYTGGTWPGVQTTDTEVKYGVTWHKYTVAADLFNLILTDNYDQTPTIADISSDTYLVYNSQGDNVGNTQYLIITDPTVVPVSANNVATTIGSSVAADVTNTHGMTLTYASSDSSIATVANDGTVTGVGAGTATITVSWNTGWDSANNGTGFLAGSVTFDAVITAPVADYATLPFSFTGGKADIENTNGLTQYSLGNDYSGTLANLGFRATGQALILKINEEPGTLTFNMRGNSFSGGTFELLESADGVNYSNVKTWTSFTGTSGDGQEETISTLASTTRYIQWVYTEKVTGNVGVGNIYLAKPVVSQYTVTPASNDNTYGSVSMSNLVITATPESGYRVSTSNPYTVTPSGAATVTDNGNGSFTVSDVTDDCTVTINFEAIPTYEVTIVAPTNGTLVVKHNDVAITSGDEFAEGEVLTIEATPAAGYNLQHWQANDGTVHSFTTTFTWTMGAAAVEISAAFVAKVYHTATFYVNGAPTSVEVEEGEAITFPSNPSDIGSKVFQGWYTAHYSNASSAPSGGYVNTSSQTMGNSDVNFYAVFADETGGSEQEVSDEITLSDTGASGSTYSDWDGVSKPSGAEYAGNNAGGNSAIQLRNGKSNSGTAYAGIISTTSGGKVKKVEIDWNSNTVDGRTLTVYGKNTAYNTTSDGNANELQQSETRGTTLGTIVCGTSTELSITGDYEYVGLRNEGSALYIDKITITWVTGTAATRSNFVTEIPVAYTMNSVGTGTYVLQNDIDAYLTYSENGGEMHIYKVDAFTNEEVSMVELGQDEDGDNGSERYLPAGTPVIIVGDADTDYSLVVAGAAAQVISDNVLNAGTDAYPSGVGPFYVLQKPAGTTEAKFYKLSDNRVVPTTSAYLDATDMVQSLPAPSPAGRKIMGIDGGDLTGIDGINNDANENVFADGKWYNLQGIEVKNPSKGIYLHNGKKVVVK